MNYEKLSTGDTSGIKEMSDLASLIVREHYDPIIGPEQNDYMIGRFQSVPAITAQLTQGCRYYFVSEPGGRKVGFLAFYPKGGALYLSKFYLHKAHRGKGIAKDMLQFLVGQARAAGLSSIVLNVNKKNSAILAYEKLGFEKIGEEVNSIGNGFFMDDWVYGYSIK